MAGTSAQDLTSFIASMGGERKLRVEENLGAGYVRLLVAEAERRQAKHDIRSVEDAVIELLRNSRDAGARHIYLASWREGTTRSLVVIDDGDGIPPRMHDRVFDARVTSKLDSMHMDRWGVHGRGMALYSIRENALEARVMSSDVGKGSAIRVSFDVEELAERADQSTWPTLDRGEDGGEILVRGPHNIVRTCCEFALEEAGRVEVFLGSPAEVLATARRRARPAQSSSGLIRVGDVGELTVPERIYASVDATELAEVALSLGIPVSERTCHRVVSGTIGPVRSVYARLTSTGARGDDGEREIDLVRDRRRRRMSAEDAEAFAKVMERAFDFVADRYYLTLTGSPRVRLSGDRLVVTFPIEEED